MWYQALREAARPGFCHQIQLSLVALECAAPLAGDWGSWGAGRQALVEICRFARVGFGRSSCHGRTVMWPTVARLVAIVLSCGWILALDTLAHAQATPEAERR